MEEERSLD